MPDFGLMVMLKVRYVPTGVTLIDNCQQCISREMNMVSIWIDEVRKS